MRYYIDHEFSEDGEQITLLSIGIVSEDGREYYALTPTVWSGSRCNEWVRNNILEGLRKEFEGNRNLMRAREEIRRDVLAFIGDDPSPEFWAYYADYDWVAFCQLFGSMVDLPKHFPMFCLDLKQEMHRLGITKEQLPPQDGRPHHALDDASWNKRAHEAILARAQADEAAALEKLIGQKIRTIIEANERLKAAGIADSDEDLVMRLGRSIGFGRILQLAPQCWDKYLGVEGPGRLHAAKALVEAGPALLTELEALRARVAELEGAPSPASAS